MASKYFKITQHKIPCQHIREYPQGTLDSQEAVLYLSVKQYTPLFNASPPADNAVSFIAGHANGFPKELYEPLWIELLQRAKSSRFVIQDIWISDVAHQGDSSVLNERTLGINQSWFDHPRDLLHMVNHFRIPRPMIGIGHSMGGANIVQLSLLHPRLLESIILIDPVISPKMVAVRANPAFASAKRRDIWPSRTVAAESFKKSKFYQVWDPRVLDLWLEFGLRDLPTAVYPDLKASETTDEGTPVTLTTPRLHEVFSFGKESIAPSEKPADGFTEEEWTTLHEMMDPGEDADTQLFRPEPPIIYQNLKLLRPSTLVLYGEISPINPRNKVEQMVGIIGTGLGGSGGQAKGRSTAVAIKGAGHLVAMEKVNDTADAISRWVGPEIERWRSREELFARYWATIPDHDKHTLGNSFQNRLKKMMAKI